MFRRATITLGIGPHSSLHCFTDVQRYWSKMTDFDLAVTTPVFGDDRLEFCPNLWHQKRRVLVTCGHRVTLCTALAWSCVVKLLT